ncbi:MAG: hypothetical protein QME47_07310 [Candidatus Thermoplasmatota archaeon]|nr:hypothetical protein [Candidatus Thermoplasmatota archaeon]
MTRGMECSVCEKGKLSYAGNSPTVRIPKTIAKFMGLAKWKEILIRPERKKKIVIAISSA